MAPVARRAAHVATGALPLDAGEAVGAEAPFGGHHLRRPLVRQHGGQHSALPVVAEGAHPHAAAAAFQHRDAQLPYTRSQHTELCSKKKFSAINDMLRT